MKRWFKVYNRLTDLSDHEYKFMVENKSKYIKKAKTFVRMLDFQEISLDRLDSENDPDTGRSFCLSYSNEATVYDPISEDRQEDKIDENGNQKEMISENNYGNPDVFVIAKILQELDEENINEWWTKE